MMILESLPLSGVTIQTGMSSEDFLIKIKRSITLLERKIILTPLIWFSLWAYKKLSVEPCLII